MTGSLSHLALGTRHVGEDFPDVGVLHPTSPVKFPLGTLTSGLSSMRWKNSYASRPNL